MQREKNVARHTVVGMPGIGDAAEMSEPFAGGELTDEAWITPLQPDVPRRGDEEKNENPVPAQQFPKTDARFAIKTGEQSENGCGVEQTVQALGHAGESRANPKANEPGASSAPALIATNRAIECTGDEGAKDRFWHHDSPEDESAAAAKMNQPGNKTAPRSAQPIADEKGECDARGHGEGDGQTHRRGR